MGKLESIQQLLRSFAPKLKYQMQPDQRPIEHQPLFETTRYLELNQMQETEEKEMHIELVEL